MLWRAAAQSAVCTHTLSSMLFYTVTHSTTAHRPNTFHLGGCRPLYNGQKVLEHLDIKMVAYISIIILILHMSVCDVT